MQAATDGNNKTRKSFMKFMKMGKFQARKKQTVSGANFWQKLPLSHALSGYAVTTTRKEKSRNRKEPKAAISRKRLRVEAFPSQDLLSIFLRTKRYGKGGELLFALWAETNLSLYRSQP